MRSFGIKLILFLLTLVLLDAGIGSITAYCYNKLSWGPSFRTSYSLNEAKQEVIILGSSRAIHHVIPAIIRDSLHMSCYNAGRDGFGIFYAQAALICILKRTTPKLIILDMNVRELTKDNSFYDRLSVLAPYYDTHPEIRPIINLRGPYEFIKERSILYRYNSLLLTIIGCLRHPQKEDSEDGYIPLHVTMKDTMANLIPEEYSADFDTVKINSFKALIAAAAGSKLVVTVSPVYYNFNGKIPPNMQLMQRICQEQHIQYIDNSQQLLAHPEYFCDRYHLNAEGAPILTRLLLREIK